MNVKQSISVALAFSFLSSSNWALAQINCCHDWIPFQARATGLTETSGDIFISCSTPVPAGVTLSLAYTAAITNQPRCPAVEGVDCTIEERGMEIYFNQTVDRPVLRIRGVRLNALSVPSDAAIVSASLSFDYPSQWCRQTTFPIAFLLPGLEITAGEPASFQQCQGGTGRFCLRVGKPFPNAFTTLAQETILSDTPPPDNGTQIRAVFKNVPRGVRITAPPVVSNDSVITLERISPGTQEGPGEVDFIYETTRSDLSSIGSVDVCFMVDVEANQYEDGAGTATAQAQLYPEPGSIVSFIHPLQNDPPDAAIRVIPCDN